MSASSIESSDGNCSFNDEEEVLPNQNCEDAVSAERRKNMDVCHQVELRELLFDLRDDNHVDENDVDNKSFSSDGDTESCIEDGGNDGYGVCIGDNIEDCGNDSYGAHDGDNINDHGNNSYGACNEDDIGSTEQHDANSDGVLINSHDVQNSQVDLSELISQTQTVIRSQQFVSANGESLSNFPSHVNIGQQGHESAYFNDNASEDTRNLDHLDDDYNSNVNYASDVEFHENMFPVKGQWDSGQGQSNGNCNGETDEINIVRPNIEDFNKLGESYVLHQEHSHYRHHGQIDNSGNNHQDPQLCDVAERPYEQTIHENLYYHNQVQHHQVYDCPHVEGHNRGGHHYCRNIYNDRRYHTIGEREEAVGSNILPMNDRHYYQHHGCIADALGYIVAGPQMPEMEVDNTREYLNSNDQAVCSHSQPGTKNVTKTAVASGGVGRKLPQVTYRLQNSETHVTQPSESKITPEITAASTKDSYMCSSRYKVLYEKDNHAKKNEARNDEKKENWRDDLSEESLEKEFMEQGGQGESQQLAQLQILYKERGRQIEDCTNQLDLVKNDSAREIRTLKHQLSIAKGEKEGAAKSLESVQCLLQESKSENAQLLGHVQACESQTEGLKKLKEELLQKLQTAESTIESLQQHLAELGSSDTLTRARQDHENFVNGLQRKYDAEIKHLKETIDCLNATTRKKDEDITVLNQKLNESTKSLDAAQFYETEVKKTILKNLDKVQKQNTNLWDANTTQQISLMKLQQALAAKSISDKMCSTLQTENQDLKEQVQMLQGASSVGVFLAPGHSSGGGAFTDQDDSMADCGIKKILDFDDTQHGTPIVTRTQNTVNTKLILNLQSELKRCLLSNYQKRCEAKELNEELQEVRKELMGYKQRCEEAEFMIQEQKKKIAEFESCFSPSNQTSVIENRYKTEIENLNQEKEVLCENVEQLKQHLVEVSSNEATIMEVNRDLRKQISDMVKEYDQDKREAVESIQRACEQVGEVSCQKLHQEMILHFDAERTEIIAKYDKKCNNLSDELTYVHNEFDKIKDEYIRVCNEMMQIEKNVTAAMKIENELSLSSAEKEWSKQKELDIEYVKQDLLQQFNKEKSKIEEAIKNESAEQLNIALNTMKIECESKLNIAQVKFENELKSLKHNLEMEKSNDLETLDNEKLNEIEKLKRILVDKELVLSEREQTFGEKERMFSARNKLIEDKDRLLKEKDMCMEELKNKHKAVMDKFEIELSEKASQIVYLTKQLEESCSLNNCLKTSLEYLKTDVKEKVQEIETLKIERGLVHGKVVKDMTTEINKLKEEIEKIQKEKETEIGKLRKEEVDNLRKEIDNNIQKERLIEIESLKKEVINLTLKMERMDGEKLSEIDTVFRKKQAEIDNLEERHVTEIERLQAEFNNRVETKVAMSKVAWLEEHGATRKAAIDNAVRLAEAELRQKMENELDARLEQRLEEVKIIWQSDNISQMENERKNWETLKNAEIMARLEEEKQNWRQTVLIPELESERQKWAKELEQRQEEEKDSWKEVELVTEKLKWTSHWEHKLQEEKHSWVKNNLEPILKKLKLEVEEKLKTEKSELKMLKEEKSISIDTVESTEAAYRKDIGVYKEKLEEANKRPAKVEKYLVYLKKKYQSICDKQREQLERGHDVAMNVMKTKMFELHKQHAVRIEEMEQKHRLEKEELLKHRKFSTAVGTPTPNVQCGVEDIDKTVMELRSQYLATVAKIKGDVLRHVTETNVRAAETIKIEVDKERVSTFREIREFYKSNVTNILQSEIISATIQRKLLAVEETLETLSKLIK